ncbi:MAG: alpha-amylase [Spirochaetes bacterium]|nr:alpha-amylase [Spirochaetota bacterium]MBU0956635.1 alpha-amylase [Spirochaetota bacterium]
MKQTIESRIFYHIYPLGMCGSPRRNDFRQAAGTAFRQLHNWLPQLSDLGTNALYIGPLLESSAHGYDTVDYYHVDRRLGTNQDFGAFVQACHERGIAVVLDAVLNHVGRDFFAFKDLQVRGEASAYRDWFCALDFSTPNPCGDSFSYEGWAGHLDLVKLNTSSPAVKEHLFGAVRTWLQDFGVDGLRLDAADVLDPAFRSDLAVFCRSVKPDCWLLGEVVHGNYTEWANPQQLDSVTNYEAYKGLWSSLNDGNFFEMAWTLRRQFGAEGLYRQTLLYNFADNHDVNRVASVLQRPDQLPLLYTMLYTMPGIPSIYYGSEFGLCGQRTQWSDAELRPAIQLDLQSDQEQNSEPELLQRFARRYEQTVAVLPPALCPQTTPEAAQELALYLRTLADLRKALPALQCGRYQEILVQHRQLVYARVLAGQQVLVALNSADEAATVLLPEAWIGSWQEPLSATKSAIHLPETGLVLPANCAYILVRTTGQ